MREPTVHRSGRIGRNHLEKDSGGSGGSARGESGSTRCRSDGLREKWLPVSKVGDDATCGGR
eukprot:13889427-Alexandrium_andersonii.AAC.1